MSDSNHSTRTNLLNQAEALFAEKGFYGTSINDVAKQLGLSKQGLLHHFSTKEKLYGAVLEQAAEYLMDEMEKALAMTEDPREQLLAIFRSYTLKDERLFRVVRLFVRELLDNVNRAEKAKKWYLVSHLQLLESVIIDGQDRGLFAPVDPLPFIYQLIGAQQYFLISSPTLQRMYSEKVYKNHVINHYEETKRILNHTLFL